MITFNQHFSEALSLKTAKKYTKMSKDKYKDLLNDVFGNEYRIYIPLDIQRSNLKTTPLIKKIKTYIENDKKIPIEEFDYLGGYVTSKKNKYKIGRLIKDNQKLIKSFEQDPLRASEDLQIVISKHPYDIAGMSTDRGWKSCMALPDIIKGRKTLAGEYKKYVKSDIEIGTLIAYLIVNTDRNINNPLSRILLKPYLNNNKDIAYGVGKIYGISNEYFKKKVQEWVNKNLNKDMSGTYMFQSKLYKDEDHDPPYLMKSGHVEMITDRDGTKRWLKNGKPHREGGPAIEFADGTKEWHINGKLHREKGPAIINANGSEAWFLNGELHREYGHAIINANGVKEWYIHGKLHREDGPARVYPNGFGEWYINGKYQKEDGWH